MKYILFFILIHFALIANPPLRIKPIGPKEKVKSLRKGQRFKYNKQDYIILPGLQAGIENDSNRKQGKKRTIKSSRFSRIAKNVIHNSGRICYFKPINSNKNRTLSSSNLQTFPVVYNETYQHFGFLSGILEVSLYKSNHASLIAKDYGIKLQYHFPKIQKTYYQVGDNQQILSVYNKLKSDKRIQKVTIEVIEHLHTAY